MVSQFAVLQEHKPNSSTSPSVIVENAPLNFVRAGDYWWTSGKINYTGANGGYTSATTNSSTDNYAFSFHGTLFYPQNNAAPKGSGFSVHCVIGQSHSLFNQSKCNSRECTIELCESRTLLLV